MSELPSPDQWAHEEEVIRSIDELPSLPDELRQRVLDAALRRQRLRVVVRAIASSAVLLAMVAGLFFGLELMGNNPAETAANSSRAATANPQPSHPSSPRSDSSLSISISNGKNDWEEVDTFTEMRRLHLETLRGGL